MIILESVGPLQDLLHEQISNRVLVVWQELIVGISRDPQLLSFLSSMLFECIVFHFLVMLNYNYVGIILNTPDIFDDTLEELFILLRAVQVYNEEVEHAVALFKGVCVN